MRFLENTLWLTVCLWSAAFLAGQNVPSPPATIEMSGYDARGSGLPAGREVHFVPGGDHQHNHLRGLDPLHNGRQYADLNSGTLYSGPITVSTTTTIKAIAYGSGMIDSAVASATYTISPVATPTFSPAAGKYTGAQTVAISTATSGASIRYTTDGSTPSETAGTLYSGPITVSATTTIKAIAYGSGMIDSAVASATYTIQ